MKLMEAVRAHLAAEEMSRQVWSYDLALALVKVKKATQADMDFFVEKERELVMRYADLDDKGNLRLTGAGTFALKDAAKLGEYERARRDLGDTEIGDKPAHFRVKAPAEIRPEHIEALEGFIEFVAEEGYGAPGGAQRSGSAGERTSPGMREACPGGAGRAI